MNENNSKVRAFTLVEILIVIAIIATLAAVAVNNLGGIFSGNQAKITKIFVRDSIKISLTSYKMDVGSYPSTEQGLKALLQAPTDKKNKWNGPYIDRIPEDPWGNKYKYRFPGIKNVNKSNGYDIWSLGEDGIESVDDIGNWDL